MEGQLQVIISVVTVCGAGVAAYVGVRVALAEVRKDIYYLRRDVDRLIGRRGREEDE